jgi:hypothetical protein
MERKACKGVARLLGPCLLTAVISPPAVPDLPWSPVFIQKATADDEAVSPPVVFSLESYSPEVRSRWNRQLVRPKPGRNLDWARPKDRPEILDFMNQASGTDFLRLASDDLMLLNSPDYLVDVRALLVKRPFLATLALARSADLDPAFSTILGLLRTVRPELIRVTDRDLWNAGNDALLTADMEQLIQWEKQIMPGRTTGLARQIDQIRRRPGKAGLEPAELRRPFFWLIHLRAKPATWMKFMDTLYVSIARGMAHASSSGRAPDPTAGSA